MDYFATSEAWSVRTSGRTVVEAANAWLHAQTRALHGEDAVERGYVTTVGALVLKGRTAHLFHVGDSAHRARVGDSFEMPTVDHRILLSSSVSCLSRTRDMAARVVIDYRAGDLAVADVFVLTTEGVHGSVPPRLIARLAAGDRSMAARTT